VTREGEPEGTGAKYRTRYLKLKSVLWDRATGLPAYPVFLDDLRTMLDERRSIGVVRIGAEGLDQVESLYGWQVLDRVRARMAAELPRAGSEPVPEGSLLCVDRVAGEALLIFVPETVEGREIEGYELEALGDAVRERLEEAFARDELAGLNPRLRFHSGHALVSLDPFRRFERGLHDAIEEARTRNTERDLRRESSWTEQVRILIEGGSVGAVFQPVVDLTSGDVLGFEALARGPSDTPIEMPRPLFDLAARAGIASELDRVCRAVVLRTSGAVRGMGKLFVNALPGSLEAGGAGGLLEQLREVALEPSDLVLEFSEREADTDPERFVEILGRLRRDGFSLALDDIGTGYASQTILERARPDYLKLDVSLVNEIEHNLIKQDLLDSLIRIASRIGAEVIGEGVETEAAANTLRGAGARYGQGYLFAAPGPASAAKFQIAPADGRDH